MRVSGPTLEAADPIALSSSTNACSSGPSRMHLDIGVDDVERAVTWALAQGAQPAEHQPQDDVRVMLDPEGHPFCLFPDDSL